MGKHNIYKGREIPVKDIFWYHYYLGLQDGEGQLLNIIDKCDGQLPIETIFQYLEERIRIATFYADGWSDARKECMDKKDFGKDYEQAGKLFVIWDENVHTLSQVRNFMIEVCGVDKYGRFTTGDSND